jgi:hypothetical protein
MTSEEQWFSVGQAMGWHLPPRAHWALRLPGIRHVRALILAHRVEAHYAVWETMFCGLRSGYDEWVIYAIRTGKC